jgi:putative endonuclease
LNWVVYILECADKSLYTGITMNLERRLAEHEAEKGARYTKGRGPFPLVYSETCKGRAEATRHETAIKVMDKAKKLLLFSCNRDLTETRRPTCYNASSALLPRLAKSRPRMCTKKMKLCYYSGSNKAFSPLHHNAV